MKKLWITDWPKGWSTQALRCTMLLSLGLFGPGLLKLEHRAHAAQPASYGTRQLEAHAQSLAGQNIHNVDAFLQTLLAPARSDQDKAWLIYSWATRHFRHDARVAAKLGDTGEQQLARLIALRRGSCAVYAHVTTQLLQKAGLEAQTIVGQALVGQEQSASGTTNHVWTQVRLNQEWWTMDSTWGAGHMDDTGFVAEPNAEFFLIKPEHSVLMYHDPKDRLGIQQQWGMGAKTFRKLPDNTLTLIGLGFDRQQVLQTAKRGARLADTFAPTPGTFTVQQAPLTRQIAANQSVQFSLATNHYQELALVQDEEWQTMPAKRTAQGLEYTLHTKPKRGDLLLMGRKPGSQNFEALLAYVVQ